MEMIIFGFGWLPGVIVGYLLGKRFGGKRISNFISIPTSFIFAFAWPFTFTALTIRSITRSYIESGKEMSCGTGILVIILGSFMFLFPVGFALSYVSFQRGIKSFVAKKDTLEEN